MLAYALLTIAPGASGSVFDETTSGDGVPCVANTVGATVVAGFSQVAITDTVAAIIAGPTVFRTAFAVFRVGTEPIQVATSLLGCAVLWTGHLLIHPTTAEVSTKQVGAAQPACAGAGIRGACAFASITDIVGCAWVTIIAVDSICIVAAVDTTLFGGAPVIGA